MVYLSLNSDYKSKWRLGIFRLEIQKFTTSPTWTLTTNSTWGYKFSTSSSILVTNSSSNFRLQVQIWLQAQVHILTSKLNLITTSTWTWTFVTPHLKCDYKPKVKLQIFDLKLKNDYKPKFKSKFKFLKSSFNSQLEPQTQVQLEATNFRLQVQNLTSNLKLITNQSWTWKSVTFHFKCDYKFKSKLKIFDLKLKNHYTLKFRFN